VPPQLVPSAAPTFAQTPPEVHAPWPQGPLDVQLVGSGVPVPSTHTPA
jgi:hypothetical protein